jgi:hypothetical protein
MPFTTWTETLRRSPDWPKFRGGPCSTTYVYALLDPRDETVRYVGVTNDPTRRLEQHRSAELTSRSIVGWTRGLAAIGLNIEMVVLAKVCGKVWERAERSWIRFFRSRGRLYNVHPGGKLPGEPTSPRPPRVPKKVPKPAKAVTGFCLADGLKGLSAAVRADRARLGLPRSKPKRRRNRAGRMLATTPPTRRPDLSMPARPPLVYVSPTVVKR